LPLEEALRVVEGLDKEARGIKSELFKLCWYMRGGLTIDEAYALSIDDREIISEIIKENLETTKKSGLPFF
jgi:hypothetical protein